MYPRIILALHQPLLNTGKGQITKWQASSKETIGHNAVSLCRGSASLFQEVVDMMCGGTLTFRSRYEFKLILVVEEPVCMKHEDNPTINLKILHLHC